MEWDSTQFSKDGSRNTKVDRIGSMGETMTTGFIVEVTNLPPMTKPDEFRSFMADNGCQFYDKNVTNIGLLFGYNIGNRSSTVEQSYGQENVCYMNVSISEVMDALITNLDQKEFKGNRITVKQSALAASEIIVNTNIDHLTDVDTNSFAMSSMSSPG